MPVCRDRLPPATAKPARLFQVRTLQTRAFPVTTGYFTQFRFIFPIQNTLSKSLISGSLAYSKRQRKPPGEVLYVRLRCAAIAL
jgi:hypothetical protein